MSPDARPFSAAAERNRAPILAELLRLLPPRGTMLEVAAGSGQHAAHFAAALPAWDWWPSDGDAASLPGIAAWCAGLANVRPPLQLDVLAPAWPAVPARLDAVYCANMIHISPWPCTAALMQGAARHLANNGLLILYGPMLIDGVITAPGNLAFDASLRERNPAWGLRRLVDVEREAGRASLVLRERVALPANNGLFVFGRAGPG
ncbi:conserved hypothetical protein [Rubrivivax sp. A210]|uniref:DUF938 domain-containing protein n=1 Tax=Rubrivivax sp. A210 TaxID=2772301 RepID=UPI0019187FDE|nr:DUF938 domain-containing protein [Rubrivivax sp. A210]CAD5371371.1 conserved hypothetical protein [Rubrivivax sp. A210]